MKKHLIELNLGLLFISTSGVMGRYIEISPPVTVWWRCALGALFLGIYCWISKIGFKVDVGRDWKMILTSSALLVLHWVSYFYSLHLSNVAIAFITLYTYPVMTTILEPLILRTAFMRFHVFLAVLVMIGVYIMLPEFSLDNSSSMGIVLGLFSALAFALRNIFSKDLSTNYNSSLLIFTQLGIGTLLLLPVHFLFSENDFTDQWPALLFLGLITTAVGHTLFVKSFSRFSVSTVSLLASIIPIYGIVLALIFLNEVPVLKTVIGGSIVLFTVFAESLRLKRSSNDKKL